MDDQTALPRLVRLLALLLVLRLVRSLALLPLAGLSRLLMLLSCLRGRPLQVQLFALLTRLPLQLAQLLLVVLVPCPPSAVSVFGLFGGGVRSPSQDDMPVSSSMVPDARPRRWSVVRGSESSVIRGSWAVVDCRGIDSG